MKNRKTFRIEDEKWVQFTMKAAEQNTNASAALREFIYRYLNTAE